MPRFVLIAFAVPVLLVAACSSSSKGSNSTSNASSSAATTPTVTTITSTTPTTNVIRATPASGSGASGPTGPGGPAGLGNGQRISGTVKAVDSDMVTLDNGSTFKLAANARVIKQSNGTDADLKTGQFVAITADRQNDNTLLATIVSIFPASLTNVPAGQRPLPGGNLMTNATISTISGKSFTVTFPGGGANVTLGPNAQVIKQVDAAASDVKVGATVGANVTDGVAQSVTITGS